MTFEFEMIDDISKSPSMQSTSPSRGPNCLKKLESKSDFLRQLGLLDLDCLD